MSTQPAGSGQGNTASASGTEGHRRWGWLQEHRRSFFIAVIAVILMTMLALLGVGLTTAASPHALTYWVSLVPVFGLLCVITAAAQGWKEHGLDVRMILRQVFHWVGIAVALALDFMIRSTGEQAGVGTGLDALLLLAVGCYLAGVHLHWLFVLVGLLLTVDLIIVAKADQYMWVLFVIGGLLIVVTLAVWWFLRPTYYVVPRK